MFKSAIIGFLREAGIEVNGPNPWDIRVHDERLFRRVALAGSLGLGDSYMDSWWDTDDLPGFLLRILQSGVDTKVLGQNLMKAFIDGLNAAMNLQSKSRAFIVGEKHYDLGNDLYEAMLDPTMSYTCAYWKDAQTLEEAQTAKIDLICRKLKLAPGMKVLEIGCGWGNFARHAAQNYGVSVVGVTVSKEQAKLARIRCEGLPVDIRLIDYRDIPKEIPERFDRAVSIEMFEAVGPKNFRTYMEVIADALKPDGLFLLQTIGGHEGGADAWIDKHIFPGGVIPSLKDTAASMTGVFILEDLHNIGTHYAPTLAAWRENFEKSYPALDHAKYDERFYRMWRYYLSVCEAGFRARWLQDWQIVLSKKLPGDYDSVR